MVAGIVERRSMSALGRMGIVVGAHAALILLVCSGLGIAPPLVEKPKRVIADFFDDPLPSDEPPPVIVPELQQLHRIELPLPEVPPVDFDQESAIGVQLVPPGQIDTGAGSADPVPRIVGARQDARHPLSQPRYPSPDIREGNEGNADVEVYVLPNGRVGDARIVRSSGFERLDQSAIEEAKRNWRLVPATRDGVPFAQWYKVRVTFKLKER
jgi:protein TonB